MRMRHGLWGHRLYPTWSSMRARCHNPKAANFKNYGARGIAVCDRWRYSLPNFLADMEASFREGASLDRIDNDGPYSPENCRWTGVEQQHRNRRDNRILEAHGKRMTVVEWAEHIGVQEETLRTRIRKGMPLDIALSMPRQVKADLPKNMRFAHRGQMKTIYELAKEFGIKKRTLRSRLVKSGWTVQQAISTPVRYRSSSQT